MIKKTHFLLFALALLLFSCEKQSEIKILSPNKNISVTVHIDDLGQLTYNVANENVQVIEPSMLGLTMNDINFSKSLIVEDWGNSMLIEDSYRILTDKKSECKYNANQHLISVANNDGHVLRIHFQVSDDGVAFRYELPEESQEINRITTEHTTFNLPDNTKAWLHPHAIAQSGWANTQPSYEEYYQMNIPVGTPSTYGQGWSFPALFNSSSNWILLSEAGMPTNYCGSHLSDSSQDGEYKIVFPQAAEKTERDAAVYPESKLPLLTPWRLIIVGKSLATIVESTMTTDVSPSSKIANTHFAKPGKAAWSWVLLKDDATIYDIQKDFIDYAADMNWEYCLIDALWDTQIGYDKIAELAHYAAQKNVGLILWYNSNGNWNEAPQTPINILFDKETRLQEFGRLHQMGIKGLKIDFFGGDGQSFMAYYQDLLTDAAKYELTVNFHGTTIPRGWNRTYPNLMTMEAVRGMEFLTFEQTNTDEQATHCAMLPFARNAVGPMDFTPVCFSEIPNLQRTTSNGFELALSVLFQSGIQHYAETHTGMKEQPDYVVDFMRTIPSHWDDIKFIDGYPGEYSIIARKGNGKWYVAGINALNEDKTFELDLSVLDSFDKGMLIGDGVDNRSFSKKEIQETNISVTLKSKGGFVIEQQ